jgi:hypothetical protein
MWCKAILFRKWIRQKWRLKTTISLLLHRSSNRNTALRSIRVLLALSRKMTFWNKFSTRCAHKFKSMNLCLNRKCRNSKCRWSSWTRTLNSITLASLLILGWTRLTRASSIIWHKKTDNSYQAMLTGFTWSSGSICPIRKPPGSKRALSAARAAFWSSALSIGRSIKKHGSWWFSRTKDTSHSLTTIWRRRNSVQ